MKISDEFVVLDTETTGPNPDRDRVIQIGWSRFARGAPVDTASRLVNPGVTWDRDAYVIHGLDGVGVSIPRGAYEVHGIAACDLKDHPRFPEVWAQCNWLPVVVTYNGLWFDMPILQREAAFAGAEIEFPPHLDVYAFCAWHFRHLKSRKLSAIANFFGIRAAKGAALHSADVDCEIAGRLALHLIKSGVIPDDLDEAIATQKLLVQAVKEESERFSYWFYEDRSDGALRMGCGRYNGKLISEVPKKEWIHLRDKATDAPDHIMAMIKEFAA